MVAKLVNGLFSDMYREAHEAVSKASSGELVETRHAYMRYQGQGHEIAIAIPVTDYNESHRDTFQRAFEDHYRALYGHTIDGIDIEVLSWTLTLTEKLDSDSEEVVTAVAAGNPVPSHNASFFDVTNSRRIDAPVFLRQDISFGATISGPALITEDQTTTVIPPGYRAVIDARGYIVMTGEAA